MIDYASLPLRTAEGHVRVVVESPRGAGIKLKYDPALRVFTFSRPLVLGLTYPFDWGFFPSTCASDGDPLDAMVLMDAPTFPGVVIACRLLGVVRVTQKGAKGGRDPNDRLIVSPAKAPRAEGGDALPKRVREEIEHFFLNAVLFEGKEVRIEGWDGAEAAEALLRGAADAFAKK